MWNKLQILIWPLIAIISLGATGCDKSPTEPEVIEPDVPDVIAPTLDSVTINEGLPFVTSRTVTLTVAASDNEGVTGILISEDAGFAGAGWQPFAEVLDFELSAPEGSKILHARVRDRSGNTSRTVVCDVVLANDHPVAYLRPPSSGDASSGAADWEDPDPVTLEIVIAQVTDMVSAIFELSFDPQLLWVRTLEVDTITGHLLASTGAQLIVAHQDVDNDQGTVRIGVLARQDGFTGVSGTGPFARITFMPRQELLAPAEVSFAPASESTIFVHRAGATPAELGDAIFIDGRITP